MRILLVHNYYKIGGGEDVVVEMERAMLERHGCEVRLLKEENQGINSLGDRVRTALASVYSKRGAEKLKEAIEEFRPSLIHIHNFFPLFSPSIHWAAHRAGIPVVQTIHNYRLRCLNGLYFRDQRPCESCAQSSIPWRGVLHRCYRGSLAGSVSAATMLTVHSFAKTWQKTVSTFIAPTDFCRAKLIEAGFSAERVRTKRHFVHPDPGPGSHAGGFGLFVGRLSEEKGVRLLLEAWSKLERQVPLVIVGDGPLEEEVERASAGNPSLDWRRRLPRTEIFELMKNAAFLVFPSLWYETSGLTLVEALACGLPIVASRNATVEEMTLSPRGISAVYFDSGSESSLRRAVEWMLAHPEEMRALSREGRTQYEERFQESQNWQRLRALYDEVLARSGEAERDFAIRSAAREKSK